MQSGYAALQSLAHINHVVDDLQGYLYSASDIREFLPYVGRFTMMIERRIKNRVIQALGYQAAVAIIGPRQVGKTTLALEIGEAADALYLDLEDRADRDKLSDPRLFLERYADSGIRVIGTHFSGPTAVHITARGESFRVVV